MQTNPLGVNVQPTYGALFIGLIFTIFFQGISTVQVYHYFENFPDDSRRIKTLVSLLWTFDFVHLILIAYSVYYYLVLNWGNVDEIPRHLVTPLSCHLIFLALSTLLSQLFFLYRIWIFSQRKTYIVVPVFLSSLTTFSLLMATAIMLFQLSAFRRKGIVPLYLAGAITDFLIAGLLCHYLRKRTRETRGETVTQTLVSQIIKYTVATTALTSVLVLGCLAAYLISPGSFIVIALHLSSGRTYTIAVLVNLNARRRFRETLSSTEASMTRSVKFAVAPGADIGLESGIGVLGTSSHIVTEARNIELKESCYSSSPSPELEIPSSLG